jgi:hypothetical protein
MGDYWAPSSIKLLGEITGSQLRDGPCLVLALQWSVVYCVSSSLLLLLLLEWLYSPCGPSPLFSFLIYSFQLAELLEWVISSSQGPYPFFWMGNGRLILLSGPLGAWGSLTCSKSTTRVKQLKIPPGGLVPWIFPSLKIWRPPPGLNPRRSSHEVGTLPLDYRGRSSSVQPPKNSTLWGKYCVLLKGVIGSSDKLFSKLQLQNHTGCVRLIHLFPGTFHKSDSDPNLASWFPISLPSILHGPGNHINQTVMFRQFYKGLMTVSDQF